MFCRLASQSIILLANKGALADDWKLWQLPTSSPTSSPLTPAASQVILLVPPFIFTSSLNLNGIAHRLVSRATTLSLLPPRSQILETEKLSLFPPSPWPELIPPNPLKPLIKWLSQTNMAGWWAGAKGYSSRRLIVFFVGGLMGTCSDELSSMTYSYKPLEKNLLPSTWLVAELDPSILDDVLPTFLNFSSFTVTTFSSASSSSPVLASSLTSISTDFLASYFPSSSPRASKCGGMISSAQKMKSH